MDPTQLSMVNSQGMASGGLVTALDLLLMFHCFLKFL